MQEKSGMWYEGKQVSFAKEPYKRNDFLQKRPTILRSLLIVATPIADGDTEFAHSLADFAREKQSRNEICFLDCIRLEIKHNLVLERHSRSGTCSGLHQIRD